MSASEFFEEHINKCIENIELNLKQYNENESMSKLHNAEDQLDSAKVAYEELERCLFLLPTNEQSAVKRKYQKIKEKISDLELEIISVKKEQLVGMKTIPKTSVDTDISLLEAHKNCEESVSIGIEILKNLASQKESLQHASKNVNLIHSSVENSTSIVGKMRQIQINNKLISYAISGLLVIAILIVLYIKIF